MSLPRNERGQISIFFSASLVVIVTVIAFVINIGLFVKAKINLQNATDAAAFSGASVQARQLTKIAYLNWEMRNIYKEWLYKYYVIGNLNIEDVRRSPNRDVMHFKLLPKTDPFNKNNIVQEDLFNIPAICIHIDQTTNICRRYSITGFPEFTSSRVSGAEEASRVFMNTLISQKIDDCNERSKLNMMVANNWTYNVLGESVGKSLAAQAPPILADRQGAWPKAVELALRIRNLEYVMNAKANFDGITINEIDEIQKEKKLGNERIVKAFYSAYRNLGNEVDNEMKNSFKLTELPPKEPIAQNVYSASNLLIPEPYAKQWVDLKLMMVNYAIFFAAMVPNASKKGPSGTEDISGACDISKVAIPVPGYPLGFYKNPDVVTYYAVKGEADFEGMFNPFSVDKITLTAYAAAKPMGGRIGPMLFTQTSGENYIRGRKDRFRSVPYLTSYQFEGVTIKGIEYNETYGAKFIPGLPIPTNSNDPKLGKFWLQDPDKPVGGKLSEPKEIQFGVPNLVYDYEEKFKSTGYTEDSQKVHIINAKVPDTEKPVGLFSKIQFDKFKGSLDPSKPITEEDLKAEIARIRAPTLYEAANYLIPTHHEFNNEEKLDSFGFITSRSIPEEKKNGVKIYQSQVYAPLYGSNQKDLLFNNQNEVTKTIFDFMKLQEPGMKKYLMAMNKVAKNIFDTNPPEPAVDSKEGYEKAAKTISDIKDFKDPNYLDSLPESCKSLAGQFLYFYFGGPTGPSSLLPKDLDVCPEPLGKLLEEYYSRATNDPNYDPDYYAFDYSVNKKDPQLKEYMTAYRPGPYTGASLDGRYVNPLYPSIGSDMRRNFYSTKFISINSVQKEGGEDYGNKGFHIFSEGEVISSGQALDTLPNGFMNVLETNDQGLNSIEH